MNRPRPTRAALALAGLLALAACGDGSSSGGAPPTSAGAAVATTAAPGSAIEISGAWARSSPMVATRGAVYLVIQNRGTTADALVAAHVDPAVAGTVELHETVTTGAGTMMSGAAAPADGSATPATAAPMMEMRMVREIALPAGATVALQPGGYHVMLLDLAAPLTPGRVLDVQLSFAGGAVRTVTATVQDTAP